MKRLFQAALRKTISRALPYVARVTRPLTMGVRAMVLDGEGRVCLIRHSYVAGWHMPGGASHAYGAPINIHFAAPGLFPQTQPTGAAEPGPGGLPSPAPENSRVPRERQDLPALPADAPPVDRSRIARALAPEERQAADVVLAFRAACLIDSDGAVVSAEDVHKRYEQWAGQRAVAAPVFARLLADVAGLQASDIAGSPHYVGVALRLGARLEAVA